MWKILKYVVAVIAVVLLYVVYAGLIGPALGWKYGGGAIPLTIFVVIAGFTWRVITKNRDKK